MSLFSFQKTPGAPQKGLFVLVCFLVLNTMLFATGSEQQEQYNPSIELALKGGNNRSFSRLSALVPIAQNRNRLFFTNIFGLYDTQNASEINIGLGYRALVNNVIYGGIMFYDKRKSSNSIPHQQITISGEYLRKNLEVRANVYLPFSKGEIVGKTKRLTQVNNEIIINTAMIKEVALSGYDAELGGQLPFYSPLSIYAAYYSFGASGIKQVHGLRVRSVLELNQYINIEGEVSQDRLRNTNYFVGLRLKLQDKNNSSFLDKLSNKMTRSVVRDIDIIEDKSITNSGRAAAIKGSDRNNSGANHNRYRPVEKDHLNRSSALKTLGLDANATDLEIKKKYRRLMIKLHPDKAGNDYDSSKFMAVQDAYKFLTQSTKPKNPAKPLAICGTVRSPCSGFTPKPILRSVHISRFTQSSQTSHRVLNLEMRLIGAAPNNPGNAIRANFYVSTPLNPVPKKILTHNVSGVPTKLPITILQNTGRFTDSNIFHVTQSESESKSEYHLTINGRGLGGDPLGAEDVSDKKEGNEKKEPMPVSNPDFSYLTNYHEFGYTGINGYYQSHCSHCGESLMAFDKALNPALLGTFAIKYPNIDHKQLVKFCPSYLVMYYIHRLYEDKVWTYKYSHPDDYKRFVALKVRLFAPLIKQVTSEYMSLLKAVKEETSRVKTIEKRRHLGPVRTEKIHPYVASGRYSYAPPLSRLLYLRNSVLPSGDYDFSQEIRFEINRTLDSVDYALSNECNVYLRAEEVEYVELLSQLETLTKINPIYHFKYCPNELEISLGLKERLGSFIFKECHIAVSNFENYVVDHYVVIRHKNYLLWKARGISAIKEKLKIYTGNGRNNVTKGFVSGSTQNDAEVLTTGNRAPYPRFTEVYPSRDMQPITVKQLESMNDSNSIVMRSRANNMLLLSTYMQGIITDYSTAGKSTDVMLLYDAYSNSVQLHDNRIPNYKYHLSATSHYTHLDDSATSHLVWPTYGPVRKTILAPEGSYLYGLLINDEVVRRTRMPYELRATHYQNYSNTVTNKVSDYAWTTTDVTSKVKIRSKGPKTFSENAKIILKIIKSDTKIAGYAVLEFLTRSVKLTGSAIKLGYDLWDRPFSTVWKVGSNAILEIDRTLDYLADVAATALHRNGILYFADERIHRRTQPLFDYIDNPYKVAEYVGGLNEEEYGRLLGKACFVTLESLLAKDIIIPNKRIELTRQILNFPSYTGPASSASAVNSSDED